METWIVFTLLAVVMQSVRTAGQKQIAKKLSVEATTLVRFLFGLPFAIAYFVFLNDIHQESTFSLGVTFFVSASLAGIAQIAATLCLVKALTIRNFAVGTALAKTEAILTALLGALFFSAAISPLGYLSVVVGVAGLLVASNWRFSWQDLLQNESIKYGLGAGLGFALASLWIRDASLSLTVEPLLSAATVLVYMVALQAVLCLILILWQDSSQLRLIRNNFGASVFIGFSSVAGSVGWFTAMSLQEAALVKTLGQLEFVVTLLITYLYFGEKISGREYIGIILVATSILLLLWAT
ncbi:MAG: DMT family transporter [Pseudomonadales bacterium]|nr:DMT family transporter [Pseudomonadales bacterium]